VGNSRYFQIWKYSNGELNFVEDRRNPKYEEDETAEHGDPGKAKAVSGVLEGVDVLIGRRFGPNITRLKDKYVCAVTRCVTIEEANAMIKTNISDIAREYKQSSRRGIVLARA
jgi:predicted Fe-Mo cluster-binding NifX family protein